MAKGRFIGYIRVSTDRQGRSGLGLEAQREAILQYLNGGPWDMIAEYVEVESGTVNERAELQKALRHCKATGATLLIARLDRLSRDLHFISSLMSSGTDFVAVDFPTANSFTIHILAAVAEFEHDLISKRTKAALAAKKAKGESLGNPRNLDEEAKAKGRILGRKAMKNKADAFAIQLNDMIQEMLSQGVSLRAVAKELNSKGVLTASGKVGSWTATAIKNLLKRTA